MNISIIGIILTIVFAALAWYANQKLNPIAVLKNIVDVIIVVAAVLFLLVACGLISGTHISIH
jgi:hypothetical protein